MQPVDSASTATASMQFHENVQESELQRPRRSLGRAVAKQTFAQLKRTSLLKLSLGMQKDGRRRA